MRPRGEGAPGVRTARSCFAPKINGIIYSVPASGGTPVAVTVFDESRGEMAHALPQFLPDGRRFLFLVSAPNGTPGTDSGFAVFAGSLGSMEKTPIVATRSIARYASSRHLLFRRDRTLVAQPFDPDTLELSGDALPLGDNLVWHYWSDTMFSVSDTGLLLFQEGAASEESRLVWLGPATVGSWARSESPRPTHPRLSPMTRSDSRWGLRDPPDKATGHPGS